MVCSREHLQPCIPGWPVRAIKRRLGMTMGAFACPFARACPHHQARLKTRLALYCDQELSGPVDAEKRAMLMRTNQMRQWRPAACMLLQQRHLQGHGLSDGLGAQQGGREEWAAEQRGGCCQPGQQEPLPAHVLPSHQQQVVPSRCGCIRTDSGVPWGTLC